MWNRAEQFILFSCRAVLNSLHLSANVISNVKRRAPFTRLEDLDYRRRTVSEDQRRACGNEIRIFTVSLNGANILSTLIHSPLLAFYSGSQDRITGKPRQLFAS